MRVAEHEGVLAVLPASTLIILEGARAFSLCTPSRFNLCGMIWGGEREAGGGGGGQQAGTVWGGLVSSAVVISTGGGGQCISSAPFAFPRSDFNGLSIFALFVSCFSWSYTLSRLSWPAGAAVTRMAWTGWLKQKHLFLPGPEAGRPRSGRRRGWVPGERRHPALQMATFLPCPHMAGRGVTCLSLKRTLISS